MCTRNLQCKCNLNRSARLNDLFEISHFSLWMLTASLIECALVSKKTCLLKNVRSRGTCRIVDLEFLSWPTRMEKAAKYNRRRQSSEVRGANVNLCQPTPCQKLKTHRIWSTIFLEDPQIHFKKIVCLGGPMPGLKDPKGPAASLRAYQSNSFSNFHNSLFFRNRKTKERPL